LIVLDTHAWIWLMDTPDRIGRRALAAIKAAERIGVSSISCWELATLVRRGRISLDRDAGVWARQALAAPRCVELPLTAEIAFRAAELDPESFPADPADRFIYATAATIGAPLATADIAISAFEPARTLWD
jgi:PIN domain nuclease of toxin-antitoxin system